MACARKYERVWSYGMNKHRGRRACLRFHFVQVAVQLRLDKDDTVEQLLDHLILARLVLGTDLLLLSLGLLVYGDLGSLRGACMLDTCPSGELRIVISCSAKTHRCLKGLEFGLFLLLVLLYLLCGLGARIFEPLNAVCSAEMGCVSASGRRQGPV